MAQPLMALRVPLRVPLSVPLLPSVPLERGPRLVLPLELGRRAVPQGPALLVLPLLGLLPVVRVVRSVPQPALVLVPEPLPAVLLEPLSLLPRAPLQAVPGASRAPHPALDHRLLELAMAPSQT
mmetsp:Transcript_92246/g.261033  ORF Transcript_92246/g.261033 Transcript_92246/m.261033 type:complete len:124 (-) Transcript_92246:440-811(-)